MNKKLLGIVIIAFLASAGFYYWQNLRPINLSNKAGLSSEYSSTREKDCVYRDSNEVQGGSVGDCPGVGDFTIRITASDEKEAMALIDKNKKEFPLNFQETITQAFDSIGYQIEWRVEKTGNNIIPRALIVPVTAFENLEKPEEPTLYMAVAKITPVEICVVAKISPQANQTEKAREVADKSDTMPCLK